MCAALHHEGVGLVAYASDCAQEVFDEYDLRVFDSLELEITSNAFSWQVPLGPSVMNVAPVMRRLRSDAGAPCEDSSAAPTLSIRPPACTLRRSAARTAPARSPRAAPRGPASEVAARTSSTRLGCIIAICARACRSRSSRHAANRSPRSPVISSSSASKRRRKGGARYSLSSV